VDVTKERGLVTRLKTHDFTGNGFAGNQRDDCAYFETILSTT
jgi:hypothetical protein